MIQIREDYCPKNHHCPVISVCPFEAISQETPFSPPQVDEELCTNCGQCTYACPVFQSR